MAEKHLKIIQNGRASFVPYSRQTVDFWTKQNSKVAGSNAAHKETVTIMPATAEEETELAKLHQSNKPTNVGPIQNNEVQELKAQLAQQQELMTMLLKQMNAAGAPQVLSIDPLQSAVKEEKERGKPGPKPKTENNGEAKETSNAQA